jgi:hypothetical protein
VSIKQNKIQHCTVAAHPSSAEADRDRLTEENLRTLQDQIQTSGGLAGIRDVPCRQIETEKRIENWLEGIGADTTGGNSKPTSALQVVKQDLAKPC